jgi:hypothetical protein
MDDDLETARLRISALQDGAVRAQALAFCLERGLFDALAAVPRTPQAIEHDLGIPGRVLPTLLAFLASQGLLERGPEGRFAPTAAARAFLVRTSPRFIGGRGLLYQGYYDTIAHLPATLASGRPVTPDGQRDMFAAFDAEAQRWFAAGMFANAVHGGRALLEVVDFAACRALLDVGGNAGGYTRAILDVHPHLRATIFDLPAVEQMAREQMARAGLAARVAFVAGSFFEDELPAGHDVALLSSVLHDWEDGECAAILGRVHRALDPGGLVVVTEPMLADDLTGPDHPSVSGLAMALLGGRQRTRPEVAALLEAAGFVDTWQGPLGAQNSTVTARKPARAGAGPAG